MSLLVQIIEVPRGKKYEKIQNKWIESKVALDIANKKLEKSCCNDIMIKKNYLDWIAREKKLLLIA